MRYSGVFAAHPHRLAGAVLALVAAGCLGPDPASPHPDVGAERTAGAAVEGLPEAVVARAAHTASSLPDGRVLVAGGCVVDGCSVGSDELILVAADGASWAAGPAMTVARSSHTTTVLDDGRAVIVGGFPGEGRGPSASVDLLDPSGERLSALPDLAVPRGGHAAAPIGGGRVLVVGGWVASRTYTATTELVDVDAGRVGPGPDLPWGADGLDVSVLDDGRVLVTGGQVSSGVGTDLAAIYDGDSGTWSTTGSMATPRFKHLSVALPDGRVLVLGGTTDDRDRLTSTEIFDPATGAFTAGPELTEPRYKMTGGAVVLLDGRVVVAGGGRSVEILDLETGESEVLETFPTRGSFATLTLLGSGDLLVLGGYDDEIDLRRVGAVLAAPSR